MTTTPDSAKRAETQKIVPCLWFDHNAEEAAGLYTRIFRDTVITTVDRYPTDPAVLPDFQQQLAGQVLTLEMELAGCKLLCLNAGPEFRPNPSINFMLHFDPATTPDAREYLDAVHTALLADGGMELMPLQAYPFSPHYTWVQDRFGVSWQLMLVDPAAELSGASITTADDDPAAGGDDCPLPFVMLSFMFGGAHQNECAMAVDSYLKLFSDSHMHTRVRYDQGGGVPELGPDMTSPATGTSVMYSDFTLAGQWLTAMDSGAPQDFTFTEGVSLIVNCADQDEIDRYWAALSRDPAAEACGWCRDEFGVSWQIVPANWNELSKRPGAYQTMMGQKKIIIAQY